MNVSVQIHSLDETSFVAGLRAGDDHAFETLVRNHVAPLLRLARRFMRTEEDARDAVQDAFIAVFKSIATFEANSRLSTWLHRVTINSCLMRLRTQRRRPESAIATYL